MKINYIAQEVLNERCQFYYSKIEYHYIMIVIGRKRKHSYAKLNLGKSLWLRIWLRLVSTTSYSSACSCVFVSNNGLIFSRALISYAVMVILFWFVDNFFWCSIISEMVFFFWDVQTFSFFLSSCKDFLKLLQILVHLDFSLFIVWSHCYKTKNNSW